MQIISLSERLTEAESGSESQLEINRKREAEMAKLRKLLEDVHTESEQQIHTLSFNLKKTGRTLLFSRSLWIDLMKRSRCISANWKSRSLFPTPTL